jgi:hypothetical protein
MAMPAQDHREHHIVAGARAIHGLGGSEAIGVILDPHRTAEGAAQIGLHRPAEEPGGTRPLGQARARLQGARNADADAALAAGLGLHPRDEVGDGAQAALIIMAWRLGAEARDLLARGRQRDAFYLGAAPIDSDEHLLFALPWDC